MRRRGVVGLLVAVLTLWLVARHRLDLVLVRGRSMAPTLQPGDRLMIVSLRRPPAVGEVVLAPDPREPGRELVKRVAGVEAGGLLVRGDHPSASTDHRVFGAIDPALVQWRVVARYWPPSRAGRIPPAPPAPLSELDVGGEGACAVPTALVVGRG